ncbi:hypothetical protein OROMI_014967 [Orobanche minor]
MAWMGQVSRNLKELRILFSPTSSSSSSTRAFIENNYKVLKTKNPKLPILIRDATGIQPQLWARFVTDIACFDIDLGIERGIRLEGLNVEQISKALEDLTKGGASH